MMDAKDQLDGEKDLADFIEIENVSEKHKNNLNKVTFHLNLDLTRTWRRRCP